MPLATQRLGKKMEGSSSQNIVSDALIHPGITPGCGMTPQKTISFSFSIDRLKVKLRGQVNCQ